MDRRDLEAMTAEERLAVAAGIEREIVVEHRRTGNTAIRFSVGNLMAEFMVWFMANLPLRDDADEASRSLAKKHGFNETEAADTLSQLRISYAKPYASAAMDHFNGHLSKAISDAIEAHFLISISEAVDTLQGRTFADKDGVLLKFPAANRARLRGDIQNLVRSQVMRQFPGRIGGARHAKDKGKWTEEEEATFVEIVAGLHGLASDLSRVESEQELDADARYRDADDRTKGYARELLRIRIAGKAKQDRRPLAVACRLAAELIGKDAYSTAYLEKLYQRWKRER